MTIPTFFIVFAALATIGMASVLALVWLGRPRGSGQSGDLKLHAVARDVYLFRGYFSNAVVWVLPERVVLVDTLISPETARLMRAAIAAVTPRPITHVILTHYNGDHVGGTTEFGGAEIICTAETARLMVTRDDERRAYVEAFGLIAHDYPPVAPPTRVFSGSLTLELDGETLELRQLGAVETADACVVWWPARRVVAVGDGVATAGFPFTGAPVVDEGLRADGQWIAFLERVEALGAHVLLPGHGPALVGTQRIADRLALLRAVFGDVVRVVREEAATGTVAAVTARSEKRLAKWANHPELKQNVATLRFAIWRVLNGLDPARAGRGWWWDYRPSPLTDGGTWTSDDATAWAARAEAMLDGVAQAPSVVEGTDFFKEAARCAREALARDARQPVGQLVLGILEVWSAVLLGQPMLRGRALLEGALAGPLTPSQQRKAMFFLGKSHQYDGAGPDDAAADRCLKQALPRGLRWAWPLLRPRLRSVP